MITCGLLTQFSSLPALLSFHDNGLCSMQMWTFSLIGTCDRCCLVKQMLNIIAVPTFCVLRVHVWVCSELWSLFEDDMNVSWFLLGCKL